MMRSFLLLVAAAGTAQAFMPMFDGGSKMPELYNGWFNDQIAKQASTAVGKAVAAGKKKIEVQFPAVPNVEEVRFGTPMNQKFGKTLVAKDLGFKGGYKPGSDISRNLIAYSNIYWAKKLAGAAKGGIMGGPVGFLTAEPANFKLVTKYGDLSRQGSIGSLTARKEARNKECIICANPGGEETWDKLVSGYGSPGAPFVILNNAYSTTYGLGNKRGYEEAYYLKRISKGWIFRSFPGPWQSYLERPDGSVELLGTYKEKPLLQDVATEVREESFKRYAINNDRWTPGFGERL